MGTPNSVTLLVNRCRKYKKLLHALFSEHHAFKTAHLSYSCSTGSQFLNELHTKLLATQLQVPPYHLWCLPCPACKEILLKMYLYTDCHNVGMSVVTRTMALAAKRSDNFFSVTNISPKLAPEKLVNTLDSKQKAFPTTHARISLWKSVLHERYYVLAQNVYCDVQVSWKDYTRGSDGKLTLITPCPGTDQADAVI